MIYRNTRKIIIRGGRYPLTNTFMFDINENEMTEKEIKRYSIIEKKSENSVY